jgi:hypothetical protein
MRQKLTSGGGTIASVLISLFFTPRPVASLRRGIVKDPLRKSYGDGRKARKINVINLQ